MWEIVEKPTAILLNPNRWSWENEADGLSRFIRTNNYFSYHSVTSYTAHHTTHTSPWNAFQLAYRIFLVWIRKLSTINDQNEREWVNTNWSNQFLGNEIFWLINNWLLAKKNIVRHTCLSIYPIVRTAICRKDKSTLFSSLIDKTVVFNSDFEYFWRGLNCE